MALVAKMAVQQCGLVSRKQLLRAGLTPRAIASRLATGQLVEALPSVYALAGVPGSWNRQLWAAHLWLGDESAVSHSAAAACWRFDGFRRGSIEISTTVHSKRPSGLATEGHVIVVHRVDEHLLSEISCIDNLPVTSPRRTLLDLCGRKHPRSGKLLDETLRRQLLEVGDLWLYLEKEWMRGRRGVRILRNLLVERTLEGAPTDSDSELALRREIDRAGLPPPTHQFPVVLPQATIHVDLAYPDVHLAIEVDSYSWHMDKTSFERDRERDAELSLLGWTVLRFTWAQIRFHPGWVIDVIAQHLAPHPSLHSPTVILNT